MNTKIKFFILIGVCFFSILWGIGSVNAQQEEKETYKAEILSVEEMVCDEALGGDLASDVSDPATDCLLVKARLLEGEKKGEIVDFDIDTKTDILVNEWDLKAGKKVVVTEFIYGDQSNMQITDVYRASSIYWFLGIYVLLVLVVGRMQGLGSLVGLGLSILVLIKVIIPMTLAGWDPISISVLGGLAVLLPSIYFSHGFNYKTTIALFGTILGLMFTGILAWISIDAVELTGFGSEGTLFLNNGGEGALNMSSILLASMIIGGIGLIDDVTVGQVAVIKEIYSENKDIDVKKLYQKAMNVGKDHIASMVNTLFLAYAASSLPLLMILVKNNEQMMDIMNIEVFAEEIIRTLVASSGLVLTVPITTLLASYIYTSKNTMYARFKENE